VLHIRPLTLADIPLGMRLKSQVGWNQLEADWRRLIELEPGGSFAAELEGDAVGTVTTCRFGPVAWVAMMVVDERFRGRGIGRALMVRALSALDSQGVRSVRLDATPLGRPLYESLGFALETSLTRFEGTLAPGEGGPGVSSIVDDGLLEHLCNFDLRTTGTDRARLLRRLAAEHPRSLAIVSDGSELTGFLMSRPGAGARQIGPCIAHPESGPLLFAEARRRYAGEPVFIDIPQANRPATSQAALLGLTAGRQLARMGRGPRIVEDLDRLWASAGPEKG
jgi:GNAT superfamily N-acetyltransferase